MSALLRYPAYTLLLVSFISCSACRNHASAAETSAAASQSGKSAAAALYRQHAEWKGVRYRYGGLSKSGVDCSGFVYLTLKRIFGLTVPRNTRDLAGYGTAISKSGLAPGDLVFFKTGLRKNHVGIYIEDGKFLHASTSKGVMLSNMEDDYWADSFWMARRVLRTSGAARPRPGT